jgi:LmbE family N-acetylglucosaminyl deacetylase
MTLITTSLKHNQRSTPVILKTPIRSAYTSVTDLGKTCSQKRSNSGRPGIMSRMVPSRLRSLVVSPHCDDAVFSCGSLLQTYPGTFVVTVCAGGPEPGQTYTEWDRASGFQASDDVMALRRQEDARALSLLGAYAIWLPFYDSQYGHPVSPSDIAQALSVVVNVIYPHRLFIPLGLFHSDHRLTSEACLTLREMYPRLAWYCYEDALYRCIPELLPKRLAQLRTSGVRVRRVNLGPLSDEQKRPSVQCYASQLRALTTPGRPGYEDVFRPERYWVIQP